MTSNINMALDDIITRRRPGGEAGAARRFGGVRRNEATRPSGGGGRFARGGARGGRELVPRDIDNGKWVHDKFSDLYGGGKRRSGGPISGRGGKQLRGGDEDMVRLNLSNLSDRVVTADLEDLFGDFGIYGVSVHYDEMGQHLGTADLFVNMRSAKDILREYSNIEIDGQAVKLAIVDELRNAAIMRTPIQERMRRINRNPIRSRKEQVGGGRGVHGVRSPAKRRPGGPKGSVDKGAKKFGSADKKKTITLEELDKQLESYMGSRHPAIQQP